MRPTDALSLADGHTRPTPEDSNLPTLDRHSREWGQVTFSTLWPPPTARTGHVRGRGAVIHPSDTMYRIVSLYRIHPLYRLYSSLSILRLVRR
jgi:hypothetical protein|eukprot:113638-Prymnesium_polylepis.1